MKFTRQQTEFELRLDRLACILIKLEFLNSFTESEIFLIEHTLIRIHNEWELFVRNFILDSATGQFFSSTGHIKSNLFQKFISRERACDFLLDHKPKKSEPKWYSSKEAILAATKLELSNLSHISAVLGVTPWEIESLRLIRNFIAHKSKLSAREIRSSAIGPLSGTISPAALAYTFSKTGAKNYECWIGFMKSISRMLIA